MFLYKVYFNKVKEEVKANYHVYQDGFLRFFKGFPAADLNELVAEFDEVKITGWQREGMKKDKPKMGFVQPGEKDTGENKI